MNSDEHIIGGMVVGAVSEIITQKDLELKNPQRIIAASLLTGFGGIIPDLLEPATNPNHRQFFHSISFGALVVAGNKKAQANENLNYETKFLIDSLSKGILTHLGLDSTTPRSLSLI